MNGNDTIESLTAAYLEGRLSPEEAERLLETIERDEQARRQELEDARSRAYAAGQEDAKAASRVAENASSAADSRENP